MSASSGVDWIDAWSWVEFVSGFLEILADVLLRRQRAVGFQLATDGRRAFTAVN